MIKDVFRAEVRRPAAPASKGSAQRHPPIEWEHNRRLCAAVMDGQLNQLRRLLVEEGHDPNARDENGNTVGHQVITYFMPYFIVHVEGSTTWRVRRRYICLPEPLCFPVGCWLSHLQLQKDVSTCRVPQNAQHSIWAGKRRPSKPEYGLALPEAYVVFNAVICQYDERTAHVPRPNRSQETIRVREQSSVVNGVLAAL